MRRVTGLALVVALSGVAGCAGSDDDGADVGAGATTVVDVACEARTVTLESTPAGAVAPPSIPDDDGSLIEAITDVFCAPQWQVTWPDGTEGTLAATAPLPREEAACVAQGLVDRLGSDRVRTLAFVGPWSTLGFGVLNNQSETSVERAEAEAMVAVFEVCTASWELLLVRSVTSGAGQMSDASANCVTDELDDDDARTILAGEIDRAYDGPPRADVQPFAELVQPLVDAFDACLSAEELDAIDWA